MSEKAVSTGNEQLMAEPRNLGCTFTSMKARNIFAIAAAQSVVEGPGVVYNPLYIYGDTGVGRRICCRSSAMKWRNITLH